MVGDGGVGTASTYTLTNESRDVEIFYGSTTKQNLKQDKKTKQMLVVSHGSNCVFKHFTHTAYL